MIYYNWQDECWEDEDDEKFFVDMTPEGGSDDPELNQKFKTQQDFFKWYNKDFGSIEEFQTWFFKHLVFNIIL